VCWQSAASAGRRGWRAETRETERESVDSSGSRCPAGLWEEEEGAAAVRCGAEEEEKGSGTDSTK
jgi:hypothetical protein